jgi:hypothetical protein
LHDAQPCAEQVCALLGVAVTCFAEVIAGDRDANPSDAGGYGEEVHACFAEMVFGSIEKQIEAGWEALQDEAGKEVDSLPDKSR